MVLIWLPYTTLSILEYIGATASWDGWDWGATINGIGEAKARRSQVLAARAKVDEMVRLDVRQAFVDVEATAVDLATETAAGQALGQAAQFAAEKMATALAARFQERSLIDLGVEGFSDLEGLRRFVTDLRGLPGVAGASVRTLSPEPARLQVFVEKLSPEDLAAMLLHLSGYSFEIRSPTSRNRPSVALMTLALVTPVTRVRPLRRA